MANFMVAFRLTGGIEGKYSNHPNDRGGETYKGIARKMWPHWKGWEIIDDLKRATGFPAILDNNPALQDKVLAFYKQNFWDEMTLDRVKDQRIANELYDTAVNCGTGEAAMYVQRILNVANRGGRYYPDVKKDGDCGNITVTAINAHPKPLNILKALNCLQGARYITICEANPSQEDFFNGWMERINEYAS